MRYVVAALLGAASYYIVSAIIVGMLINWCGVPEREAQVLSYILLGALSGVAVMSAIRTVTA